MTTGAARIAVIWDIGGHCDPLDDAFFELVADTRARTLSDGLTVVQVGELLATAVTVRQ